MKPHRAVIELDCNDLQSKLDEIEAVMGAQIVRPFRQLLQWYMVLVDMLRENAISIKRLRKMLFGASTERASKLFPKDSSDPSAEREPAASQASASTPNAVSSATDAQKQDSSSRRRRRGHGRIPARAYVGCAHVVVTHGTLHPGDQCPHCVQGTLYRQRDWTPVVRLKGQPPVGGTVYELERLRCHLCGAIATAELPEEAGPKKFDPTVASVIAMLRYGEGLPWNRIQRIQQSCGVPLPASTQWDVVRDAVDGGPRAAYDHLLWLAAQGELIHNDDTSMRVLALMDRLKKQLPLIEKKPDRRGVFTSSILSIANGRPAIALFFTGPYHAGENLKAVLANRQEDLPPPIQMCDGLSRNIAEDLRVILANCLTHSRRRFADVADAFPNEVEYVVECLGKVYTVDDEAKKQQLSADQRLRLHQQKSRPVMDELRHWLNRQFDDKQVEPNSSLGEAIAYMLRHWDELTLFLRTPGAPLDNNLCEQALKMAILHRKNSLFYKTMRGAEVGDLYMTLIHTCYFSAANPFDYLTELQRNQDRVKAAPGDWTPWNYRQQLASAEPASPANCTAAANLAGHGAHPPPPARC
jgi:hypothetical protein